jgi:hypothetical protein
LDEFLSDKDKVFYKCIGCKSLIKKTKIEHHYESIRLVLDCNMNESIKNHYERAKEIHDTAYESVVKYYGKYNSFY